MRSCLMLLLAVPLIPVCVVLEGMASIAACCGMARTEIAIGLAIDFMLSVVLWPRGGTDGTE